MILENFLPQDVAYHVPKSRSVLIESSHHKVGQLVPLPRLKRKKEWNECINQQLSNETARVFWVLAHRSSLIPTYQRRSLQSNCNGSAFAARYPPTDVSSYREGRWWSARFTLPGGKDEVTAISCCCCCRDSGAYLGPTSSSVEGEGERRAWPHWISEQVSCFAFCQLGKGAVAATVPAGLYWAANWAAQSLCCSCCCRCNCCCWGGCFVKAVEFAWVPQNGLPYEGSCSWPYS